jgi:SAM-dependent methyltransferase
MNRLYRAFLKLFSDHLVAAAYAGVLRRAPDDAGRAAYAAQLSGTGNLEGVFHGLSRSDELLRQLVGERSDELVAGVFRGVLRRDPEPEAREAYRQSSGLGGLQELIEEVAHSPEHWNALVASRSRELVSVAFRAILGREPEAAALDGYAEALSQHFDLERLLAELVQSQEHRQQLLSQRPKPRAAQIEANPAPASAPPPARFSLAYLDRLKDLFQKTKALPGTEWEPFRNAFLKLPEWFRLDLDPMSDEYARQQTRLWQAVAGIDRDYDPRVDEETTPPSADAVRFPAYFGRRDPAAVDSAADHVLATGMILKHSGIKPGEWALEYGAGFGQTALALSRLGVNVDTVDISEGFCAHVKAQADFFGVPLTPFQGAFGWNPRGDQKYDLIWFYESFHHCVDFRNVVSQLARHLAQGGKIVLAGEPIVARPEHAIPYPWGLRLDAENIAVIRQRRWFELGFTEDFLVGLFVSEGFSCERMVCPASRYGEGYVFKRRSSRIDLGKQWLPPIEDASWFPAEANGRWSRSESYLTVDATGLFDAIEVDVGNHHPFEQEVDVSCGNGKAIVKIAPAQTATVRLAAQRGASRLVVKPKLVLVPSTDYPHEVADDRALGVLVHEVRYR